MTKTPPAGVRELDFRIRQVEIHLRRRQWYRCWIRFGFATLALTIVFTPLLAMAMRIGLPRAGLMGLFAVAEMFAAWLLLVQPLRKKISARQIALLIDERHPELENRILSAVEFSREQPAGASAWMIEKFLEDSRGAIRQVPLSDIFDSALVARLFFGAAAFWTLSFLVMLAFHGVWLPSFSGGKTVRSIGAETLDFTVEPGNARVRAGDNQVVLVKSAAAGRKVAIQWRDAGATWQSAPMSPGSSENVHYHPFSDIRRDIEYSVECAGRSAGPFKLTVWTPPEVGGINLTYHYPDYLGMPPREVPNSGNVTAIEGTQVDLTVEVNKDLASAELVLKSGVRMPLTRKSGSEWHGRINVASNDKYRIELTDQDGAPSEFNPEYDITAQTDKPPKVEIEFPRGDSEVSSLEEVPFNFKVSDDFGLAGYGLSYEVAGQPPVRLALGDGNATLKAEGHHELALEDMHIKPGDLITWTVWAKDKKPERQSFEEFGDPFFLEVRPFQRRYEEAVSNGGGGGMQMQGQGGEDLDAQKDIVIAIWNLRRDARTLQSKDYLDRRGTVHDAQAELLQKLSSAQPKTDEGAKDLKQVTTDMAETIRALKAADLPEPDTELSSSLASAQRAYRGLLKLQSNEFQVQQSRNQGGGGGGQSKRNPKGMDALELSRNKNFYEDEKKTQDQQGATNETLSRIKELAKRQQMINEEIARLVSEIEKAKTDEEKRELERQLEKLREEEKKNLERLDEVQRDLARGGMDGEKARETRENLDEARQQMKRTLDAMDRKELQPARSAGARASSSLSEIEQNLEKLSRGAAAEKMAELRKSMEELEKKEDSILNGVADLKKEQDSPDLASAPVSEEKKTELLSRKKELATEFTDLMNEAGDLADRGSQSQELMSRKLGDWLRETSRDGVMEDIQEGEPLIRYGIWDSAKEHEQGVKEKLDRASSKLDRVASSSVENDLEAMQKSLAELQRMVGQGQQGEKQLADATGGMAESNIAQEQKADGESKAQGEEPGTESGDGKKSEEGENGKSGTGKKSEKPGDTPGEQGAESQKPGEKPGKGQGRQTGGEKPPDSQGAESGASPAAGAKPGQGDSPSQQPAGGQPNSGASRGGTTEAGGFRGGAQFRGPAANDLRNFFQTDASRWLDQLRDAEALLPADSPYRSELTKVRDNLQQMRQWTRRNELAPKYDLFLSNVMNPLTEAAANIDREIQKQLKAREFVLTDDGSVPAIYKKRVAEYFETLAQSEGRP